MDLQSKIQDQVEKEVLKRLKESQDSILKSAELSLAEKLKDIMSDFADEDKVTDMWPDLTSNDSKDSYFQKIHIEIDVENHLLDVHTEHKKDGESTAPGYDWKFDGQ